MRLAIHTEQPFYCEDCDHTFGPDYTAHHCPYPQAMGQPRAEPDVPQLPRWIKRGDHRV